MEFDPQVAAPRYAQMETDELVDIAFLDPNYLPEAKLLAKSELSHRGVSKIDDRFLDSVRGRRREARTLRQQADRDHLHAVDRFTNKVREIFLVGALWVMAPLIPTFVSDADDIGFDWKFAVVVALWAAFAFIAFREAKAGRPKQLYMIVIVPLTLLLISVVVRIIVN